MERGEEVKTRKKRFDPERGMTELWLESDATDKVTFTDPCSHCGNKKRECLRSSYGPRKRVMVSSTSPNTTTMLSSMLQLMDHITSSDNRPIYKVEIKERLMQIKRQIEEVVMDGYGYLLGRDAKQR
ncbi:uncharacterized protein LOC131233902 [Magnolia sinica]|uniref:uncharacterized protein LOC131233902 n=1 Tax=Magnolia sinica TaxID=86752 RepID=UPI00265AB8D7|nr:uncharacterized protein LOC131233902 [Magnolia sinica]